MYMQNFVKINTHLLLTNLLISLILHIKWIIYSHRVDDYFVWQLHSNSLFVDRNFSDVIFAFDLDLGF